MSYDTPERREPGWTPREDPRRSAGRWAPAAMAWAATFAWAGAAGGAEPVDLDMVARIKVEAFQGSRVMDTAFQLTEVHGPRLTGSEGLRQVAQWSRRRLEEWGLESRIEEWPSERPTWSVESYSLELLEPRYLRLNAQPAAWTPATDGEITGVPVVVAVGGENDFESYRGKLGGHIVLNTFEPPTDDWPDPPRRFDEAALAEMVAATDPGEPRDLAQELVEWEQMLAPEHAIARFFRDEGVAALLLPSSADHGVVRVTMGGAEGDPDHDVPTLVVGRESFHMLVRLVERGYQPQVRAVSRVRIGPPAPGVNVIAEIPGHDPRLADQVVMLGGHLDSWHAGTGATDNAAGCAVLMEAVRVLQAVGARPRRTIRLGLWSGEEEDYGGSMAYVAENFGDPATGEPEPGNERLSAYYNLDGGTGRIRGVYLQGNERARPILAAFLEPFAYLGADHLTGQNTSSTDHMVFDAAGVPAFTFIQDALDYDSLTHHTDQDVYDNLDEEDLKQAAAVVASIAYQTAMRNEPMPRVHRPRALPRETRPAAAVTK